MSNNGGIGAATTTTSHSEKQAFARSTSTVKECVEDVSQDTVPTVGSSNANTHVRVTEPGVIAVGASSLYDSTISMK